MNASAPNDYALVAPRAGLVIWAIGPVTFLLLCVSLLFHSEIGWAGAFFAPAAFCGNWLAGVVWLLMVAIEPGFRRRVECWLLVVYGMLVAALIYFAAGWIVDDRIVYGVWWAMVGVTIAVPISTFAQSRKKRRQSPSNAA